MKTSQRRGVGGGWGGDGRLADCCEEFVAVISPVVLPVSYSPATAAGAAVSASARWERRRQAPVPYEGPGISGSDETSRQLPSIAAFCVAPLRLLLLHLTKREEI